MKVHKACMNILKKMLGGRTEKKDEPLQIIIRVDGGVADVLSQPPNTQVVIRDYDINDCPEEELSVDDNGDTYEESIWG